MRGILVMSCLLCLSTPRLLAAQRFTLSGEFGVQRSTYPGGASPRYMARTDGATVKPVGGPLVGVRAGLRVHESIDPVHRVQLEFRLAYSPELVALHLSRDQVPEGSRLVTDHTAQTLFASSQLQLIMSGSGRAFYYIGVGPGIVRRSGWPLEGAEDTIQGGLMLGVGIVSYWSDRMDMRASLGTLATDSHLNVQISVGFVIAFANGDRVAP
jgi:hypothetical protein